MELSPAAAAVENEDFYHGLLPREDLAALLRHNGDFLIRLSEEDKKQAMFSGDKPKEAEKRDRMLILSLFISPIPHGMKGDKTLDGVHKHYKLIELPGGKLTIDHKKDFTSVKELLEYYVGNKPLNENLKESIPVTPILRQRWELLHENITTEVKLGEGAFGEVCKGKLKIPDKDIVVDVAIKVAKATAMNKEKIKEVMKEARIMRNFDHNNVVKLYGVAVFKEPLMIVMELVTGGALDEYLKKNETTPEQKTAMAMGASWGVAYLHEKKMIHRDLAARNCLFNNGVCKISDFGLTREGYEYKMKLACKLPIRWLAPETIRYFFYSHKTDVWSFGVLVWEIFSNSEEPYAGMKFSEVKDYVLSGHRLKFPEFVNDKVKFIIQECWMEDPLNRKTMRQVVSALEKITGLKEERERANLPDEPEGVPNTTVPPTADGAPPPDTTVLPHDQPDTTSPSPAGELGDGASPTPPSTPQARKKEEEREKEERKEKQQPSTDGGVGKKRSKKDRGENSAEMARPRTSTVSKKKTAVSMKPKKPAESRRKIINKGGRSKKKDQPTEHQQLPPPAN